MRLFVVVAALTALALVGASELDMPEDIRAFMERYHVPEVCNQWNLQNWIFYNEYDVTLRQEANATQVAIELGCRNVRPGHEGHRFQ